MMRALSWLIYCFSALLWLGSCQLDPYRIPSLGDGGVRNDGKWRDAVPLTDSTLLGDALPDGPLADVNYDACIAMVEACNGVDDNCNGEIDEGLDKLNDPRYCEECKGCNWLLSKNAFPGCDNGSCTIASCKGGYIDQNNDVSDGCEYLCTPTGLEICDGVDNDCNNLVDDGLITPNICLQIGLCAGAVAVCKGEAGWQCEYPAGVELQPCIHDTDCGVGTACDKAPGEEVGVCPGIVIVDEKKCDGVDGDCDGEIDDPWARSVLPNALGKECDVSVGCTVDADCGVGTGSVCDSNNKCTPKKGVCRDVGEWKCDPVSQDKTTCQLVTAGQAPGAEICNNIDDDCDGVVDNLDLSQTPDAEMWVTVGAFQIFKYEASRSDATATDPGEVLEGRPCSLPGRLPWSDITKEEAQAACASMGAHLCKSTDWRQACRGQSNTLFPYGPEFNASICNGRAYDIDPSTPANDDGPLPTDQPATCVSSWPGGDVVNMSGNVKEWTATDLSGGNPTGYEIKGGAFDTPSLDTFGAGLSCDYDLPAPASTLRLSSLGFRCCKTP